MSQLCLAAVNCLFIVTPSRFDTKYIKKVAGSRRLVVVIRGVKAIVVKKFDCKRLIIEGARWHRIELVLSDWWLVFGIARGSEYAASR